METIQSGDKSLFIALFFSPGKQMKSLVQIPLRLQGVRWSPQWLGLGLQNEEV